MDEVAKFGKTVTITKNGVDKAVLLAKEELEGLIETVTLMSDKDFMKKLKQAEREATRGETVPWEKIKKELDL